MGFEICPPIKTCENLMTVTVFIESKVLSLFYIGLTVYKIITRYNSHTFLYTCELFSFLPSIISFLNSSQQTIHCHCLQLPQNVNVSTAFACCGACNVDCRVRRHTLLWKSTTKEAKEHHTHAAEVLHRHQKVAQRSLLVRLLTTKHCFACHSSTQMYMLLIVGQD